MPSVHAQALCFAHVDWAPLLVDVSFDLVPGFTGVVGANGAGKSTLARLIAGELEPSSGRVRLSPPEARVELCEQVIDAPSRAIRAFAAQATRDAERIRGLLRLRRDELERFATLSPGERKRWQIGAALANEPEVLLLDEPTNHLDAAARELLISALRRFRGVGLLVSHDRELLEALTTKTLRLAQGRAELYEGGYGKAHAAWSAEAEREAAQRAAKLDAAERLARSLAQKRVEHAAAARNVSARARMRTPHDHDARSILGKNLASWAAARHGRDAGKLAAALARAETEIPEFVVDKSVGRSLFAGYATAPRRHLMTLVAAELRAGNRVLLRDVSVVLGRDDRVAVTGRNGTGKTTLLAALVAQAGGHRSRITYLPQELTTAEVTSLLRSVEGLPRAERGRLLGILAALGVDPERVLASPAPSPGEARKLLIASGLARHAWALVLDEPSNHLDLPSIERLEAALEAYPGALLIVSHDAAFAGRVTTTQWNVDEGHVRVSAAGEWDTSRPLPDPMPVRLRPKPRLP